MIYPSAETNYVPINVLKGNEFAIAEGLTEFKLLDGAVIVSETTATLEPTSVIHYELAPSVLPEGQYTDYTLRVKSNVGLKPYLTGIIIRVGNYQNLTVTPDQVRSRLGLNDNEVPDSLINLPQTYFDQCEAFTPEFHVERETNKSLNRKFMELVLTTEVAGLGELLPLILSEREETDNNVYVRSAKAKDLINLADKFRAAKQKALDALSEFLLVQEFVPSPELFIVGERPDVVTGA